MPLPRTQNETKTSTPLFDTIVHGHRSSLKWLVVWHRGGVFYRCNILLNSAFKVKKI